jgi:hypothetical protein
MSVGLPKISILLEILWLYFICGFFCARSLLHSSVSGLVFLCVGSGKLIKEIYIYIYSAPDGISVNGLHRVVVLG